MLELNPEQLEAIEHGDGPLLIIAGPGSGKTRVITQRIVHLLENTPGLQPQNILALTFTDKAAGEMKSRVREALPALGAFPHVSTFHAFAYEVVSSQLPSAGFRIQDSGLRPSEGALQDGDVYPEGNAGATLGATGLSPANAAATARERMLLDKEDVWVFLRQRMEQLQLEFYRKLPEPGAFLHALSDFFSRCQDELIEPDDFEKYVLAVESVFQKTAAKLDPEERAQAEEEIQKKKELSRVFRNSRRLLERAGSSSLGSLIPEAVRLLDGRPEIRRRYQTQFRFVLVDEFQDTNYAQIELLKRLVTAPFNITAVGDDDQAIYRFRGASHGAFDMFAQAFPGHRTIFLNRNYRSTQRVLRVADAVIKKNATRQLGKPELRPEREEGCPVYLAGGPDYASEAIWVAEEIERLVAQGRSYRDIAVLYRAHNYRDRVVEEFGLRGIPFAIRGLSVLSTAIIRDLLAYLNLALSPHDNISLTRVLLAPGWNFPEELAQGIRVEAGRLGCSIYDALASLERASPQDPAETINGTALKNSTAMSGCATRGPLETTNWAALKSLLQELHWAAQNGTVMTLFKLLCERLELQSFLGERDLKYVRAFEEFLTKWEEKISKFPALAGPEWEDSSEQKRPKKNLAEFMDYFQDYLEAGGKIAAPEPEKGSDAVQMMTVHAAKGLEFPIVFLLSVAPRRFPSIERRPIIEFPDELRKGPMPPKDIHLQEERRLFFVALSRAQDRLYVSSVVAPGKKPSKFVEDICADPVVAARDIERLQVREVAPFYQSSVIPTLSVAKGRNLALSPSPKNHGGVPLLRQRDRNNQATSQQELFTETAGLAPVLPPIAEWARREPDTNSAQKLRLSASSIEDYEDCPLKFKFSHYLRIPTGPQAALTFGNIMHRSVRRYFDLRATGEASFEAVKEFYESAWRKTGFEDDYQEQAYKEAGLEQLRVFVERQAMRETLPLSMETAFSFDLGEVRLEGRIDQINSVSQGGERAVELVDYKTGKPRSQKDADQSLQLSVYALAAQEQMKLKPVRLTFYCLTNNEPVYTVRTAQNLKAVQTEILNVAERIRQNDFSPTPGFVCKFCDYRPICPAHEENV